MNKIFRFPLINVLIIFGITLFFAFQLPDLYLDNEVMNFVPQDDPALVSLEEVQDQYGSALIMVLLVRNPYASLLSQQGLDVIEEMTLALEDLDGLEKIQSLSNTDFIDGEGGTLRVSSLSRDGMDNPLSPEEVGRRINSWDMYDNLLISEDLHSTQIGLTIKNGLKTEEREELYNQIEQIAQDNIPQGYSFNLAGLTAITTQISKNMRQDLVVLIPFVSILVLLILYLSFRRIGGVLLPILNVVVSTIWTLGIMALTHVPLSILGSIIPVLMIAVGSAYGIHLVSHFYDEMERSDKDDKETKRHLVFHTVKVVGIPVIMAGLTTMAGFGALAVSSVIPMKIFGIFTAFGVGSALIVALTLIPSLLLLHPVKKRKQNEKTKELPLLNSLIALSTKKQGLLVIITLILFASAIYFTPRVKQDNNLIAYFKEGTAIREADEFINRHFAGTTNFNIIIKGQDKGDLNNPEILQFMDQYKSWITSTYPEVKKVISYSDFVKRINQVLHQDTPGRFTLNGINQSPALTDNVNLNQSSDWDNGSVETQDSDWGSDWGDSQESDWSSDWGGSQDSDWSGENGEAQDSSWSDDSSSSDLQENQDAAFPQEETEQTARETPPLAIEASPLMDSLWQAYLGNPQNFMVELARLTNHQGMDYYEIPLDPQKYGQQTEEDLANLISQYLLLYSGNLSNWSDEAIEPTQAKMTAQLSTDSSLFTDQLVPDLQRYADLHLPQGYTIDFVGTALVQGSLTKLIVKSAVMSILLSIVLVFLILSVTYKSIWAGLMGIVPLSLTVMVNFGLMGLTGIKLDISTAMVGSIAIGIGIDYTIHFLSSYGHHFQKDRSPREITHLAMHSSGKAIIYNALSVAAGFAVLLFSRFNPLMYFGGLIVMTMAISSLSALTLLPLMLNHFRPKFLIKLHEGKLAKERE
ncbi:MAG: MMPL family transporter [Spirochaetaceae bacterium]|nr:MMPL family transporter [Spirochaetaceae bacterium]